MREDTLAVFIIAMIWVSVASAVIAGLYYTHDIKCLWFLIVPLFTRVKVKTEAKEERDEEM